MNREITVQTTSGPIIGLAGYQFLGVPYGTAKRFQTARMARWDDPKICTKYGNIAPQPNFLGKRKPDVDLHLIGDEDCLNLNIWTPSINAESKLPVVIYIHGGAFQTGSNSDPERSGNCFAKDTPMVFVSVNYRLGALGGMYLGDLLGEEYRNSGSNSALDVMCAIRWVKANAMAFGGDPENITLMGISAGAKCIGALMTLDESDHLFSKVVLESGATQSFRSVAAAKELRDRYMTYLDGTPHRELLDMPVEKILMAQVEFCNRDGSTNFYGPVLDEITFQSNWPKRWENGKIWKGKALIGSGIHEMGELAKDPEFSKNPLPVLHDLFGGNAEILLQIHDCNGIDWTKTLSDGMYRSASDHLASRLAAHNNHVWVYSFDYLPAYHGMGFRFIMQQETTPIYCGSDYEWSSAKKTAEHMQQCVRDFIVCGTPDPKHVLGWESLSAGRENKYSFGPRIALRPFRDDSLKEMPEYTYCEQSIHTE